MFVRCETRLLARVIQFTLEYNCFCFTKPEFTHTLSFVGTEGYISPRSLKRQIPFCTDQTYYLTRTYIKSRQPIQYIVLFSVFNYKNSNYTSTSPNMDSNLSRPRSTTRLESGTRTCVVAQGKRCHTLENGRCKKVMNACTDKISLHAEISQQTYSTRYQSKFYQSYM